jgi:hypothetical protein
VYVSIAGKVDHLGRREALLKPPPTSAYIYCEKGGFKGGAIGPTFPFPSRGSG